MKIAASFSAAVVAMAIAPAFAGVDHSRVDHSSMTSTAGYIFPCLRASCSGDNPKDDKGDKQDAKK